MIVRYLLALAALLLPMQVLAQDGARDLEGAWALRIDGAAIFRFDIARDAGGAWEGIWTRPDSFASNGAVFARLEGAERLSAMAALELDGEVELSFDDPRPGAIPDIFRFRPLGDGRAELIYVGTGLAPYPLVRVAPGTPLGPFEEGRLYDRDNAQRISDYAPAAEEAPETTPEPARSRMAEDFLEGL